MTARFTIAAVIPAYNAAPYIGEALDSVLRQSRPPDEVVVVDDGSTDDTAEIVARYGDPIRLIRQQNRGEGAARNRGVTAAGADLIAFLDADDVWLPHYLESQMAVVEAVGGSSLIFSEVLRFTGSASAVTVPEVTKCPWRIVDDPVVLVVRGFPAPPAAVVVPRAALLAAGPFNEDVVYGVDANMWLRLARMGVRFCLNPAPLALYRTRPDSLSNSKRREWTEHLGRALRHIERDAEAPPHVRAAARRRARGLAARYRFLARDALRYGNAREAQLCMLAAVRTRPWDPRYAVELAAVALAPRLLRRLSLLRGSRT